MPQAGWRKESKGTFAPVLTMTREKKAKPLSWLAKRSGEQRHYDTIQIKQIYVVLPATARK
jgi:hypothetical protein